MLGNTLSFTDVWDTMSLAVFGNIISLAEMLYTLLLMFGTLCLLLMFGILLLTCVVDVGTLFLAEVW